MQDLLRPFLDRWRLVALLASGAMLAVAHAFETFGHMAPCELCLKQRTVYWVAMGVAAAGMVVVRLPGGPRWRAATCWLLGLIFLVGAGVAAYHAGVEWKFWPGPASCTGATKVDISAIKDLLKGGPTELPKCDKPAWIFLGVSMAGWNTVASLILVGFSAAAAVREGRKA
jgi:disulfide bond formation protein DsbB